LRTGNYFYLFIYLYQYTHIETHLFSYSVLSTVIAQRASIERVEVLPAPRELDPQLLVWKGASVMSKLDTAKDMWIGAKEWEETGARCFRERALIM
jgi:actin-related protein 8